MECLNRTKRKELNQNFELDLIIGEHPSIIDLLELVVKIADTDATVLIYGESGTGKELISHALHNNSSRKNKPFVPLNCGALPETLLESELFGHVKGAFTGAFQAKKGWFEYANRGTIFLDEINEMSPVLQVKLLRVLQTGEYHLVGGSEFKKCHVRVIAATSKDLQELIKIKKFREELFYRLNVIDITIPPLRERRSDIPLLIEYFIKVFSERYNKKTLTVPLGIIEYLKNYDFPGNVRELKNIVERMVILSSGNNISKELLPIKINSDKKIRNNRRFHATFKNAKQEVIEKFEQEYLSNCLKESNGNITRAAKNADLHITNFYSKMKKYQINPHSFKNYSG